MDIRDYLSEDGQAVLLLCSPFGQAGGPSKTDSPPYTLAEWNQLARKIHASTLQRPGALLGCSATKLAETIGLPPVEGERIARLIERSGRVTLELEGLFSRGIWAVTRLDSAYPAKLRQTLKHQAPPVLFGAGEIALLERPGIGVVGSRQIDDAGKNFAQEIGRQCARAEWPVVSGGARGTDSLAMEAAIEAGGTAFGVLADSLERMIRSPELRQMLLDRRLVLLTPYSPAAGFSIGAAMGRNKVIYGLADYAIVVSSDYQKGGTWAGAVEALKARWCPLFIRVSDDAPPGNLELIKKGARPLDAKALPAIPHLAEWLRAQNGPKNDPPAAQPDLFAPNGGPLTK